jgi:hypothetical protein
VIQIQPAEISRASPDDSFVRSDWAALAVRDRSRWWRWDVIDCYRETSSLSGERLQRCSAAEQTAPQLILAVGFR